VYFKNKNDMLVIVLIYVDDLMVASNDERALTALKSELAGMFDMKDMGLLKYCLGIEFEQNLEKHEIKMHQQCYAKEVIKQFDMENSNTVSTPLAAHEKLSKDMASSDQEESPEIKDLPYQSLIGSLMYMAVCTRPDISHAVSLLSQ